MSSCQIIGIALEITFLGPRKYLTLSFISFVPNPQIVRNVIKDVDRHDPKPCSSTSLEMMPSEVVLEQENDDPGDITAVMSDSDTLTTTVPLLIGGESTTPVIPVTFATTAGADIPGECMQCEKLKNSLRKYQKENSRLKRVNLKLRAEIDSVGHVLLSLQSSFLYNLSLWMRDNGSYSTGIGITINRRKMVKL